MGQSARSTTKIRRLPRAVADPWCRGIQARVGRFHMAFSFQRQ